MAVVMTTKFYEEDTPAWHDLSKIVFTSPNIDSPNTAGTRSHILPGQEDLGLWYEDTSNMYRISGKQDDIPIGSTHPLFMGKMDLCYTAEFSFITDNSVLIDFQSIGDVNLQADDVLYYDVDNYGTVVSTTTVTSGILGMEAKTITIYDGFSDGRRSGYSYNVYWEATGIYTYDQVNIYYSIDGGINWVSAVPNSINDGIHTFIIPTITNTAKLKVESVSNPSVKDESDLFTITEGTFNTITPATGIVWDGRTTHKVWWNCSNFFQDELISVDISFDNGNTWDTMVSGVANNGSTKADFPVGYSTATKTKVFATENPSNIFDESGIFTTSNVESVILTPSSTDVWNNYYNHKVWWNSNNFYDDELLNVKISYDNGNFWEILSSGIVNTGYCPINIPVEKSGDHCYMKIQSINIPDSIYTTVPFTVYSGTEISIRYPYDDIVGNGATYRVWWDSINFPLTSRIDVSISIDNGISWNVLTSSGIINTGYVDILIPYDIGAATNSLIRVRDYDEPIHLLDTNTITVVSGGLDLKWPAISGNPFVVGDDFYVWWNSDHIYDNSNVTVSLSTNSGIDYTVISDTIINTGTDNFVLDSISSSAAKIKVSKNDGTEGIDIENEDMFIIEDPYINILSPVSGTIIRRDFTLYPPYGAGSTEYSPASDIGSYYNTNIYSDKTCFKFYKSYDGGGSFEYCSSNNNTGIIANVLNSLDTITDQAVVQIRYNNDAGTVVSGTSEEFKVRDSFTKVDNSFKITPMDYWSSSCRYGNYIYRISGYDNKIYRFDVDTNGCEFVVSFTEAVIEKPYLTIKNGIYYIVDQDSLSFYSYTVSDGFWRVLSSVPNTPRCLKSTTDADDYIYTLAGEDWYKFDVVEAGAWEYIQQALSDSYEASTVWKGDVITVSGVSGSKTYFSWFEHTMDPHHYTKIFYKTTTDSVSVYENYRNTADLTLFSTGISQSGDKVITFASSYGHDIIDDEVYTDLIRYDVDVDGTLLFDTVMSGTESIVTLKENNVCGGGLGNSDVIEYKDDKWLLYTDADDVGIVDDVDSHTLSSEPKYADYSKAAVVITISGSISYINKER